MNATRTTAIELMKQDLIREAESLFSAEGNSALALTMRQFFPGCSQAFILYWLPEQAEDIYWVLISPAEIAKIEIPRNLTGSGGEVILEMLSLENYRKRRLSRDAKRKLEIALALIQITADPTAHSEC